MLNIEEITNIEDLEEILNEQAEENTIILFKYSPYCTISFVADKVIAKWLKKTSEKENLTLLKINVISARPLSNYIAGKYDVKHESPQLFWLERNNIKWHGSHHRITENQLDELLNN